MDRKKVILSEAATIIIILALSIYILVVTEDSSCNKCQIKFKNTAISGYTLPEPVIYTYNITELYEGIIQNKCIVTWSRTHGYIEH